MLIYSMSVSVDGFIADRTGGFGWTVPNEEQFRFHLAQTRELGGYLCGRRLYQTMLTSETANYDGPAARGRFGCETSLQRSWSNGGGPRMSMPPLVSADARTTAKSTVREARSSPVIGVLASR